MIKLSSSTLNLFSECPRCFWLSVVKKVSRPKSIFPSLPSGIDLVLKNYFNHFRKKGEIPHLLKGKLPGKIVHSLPRSFQFYSPELNATLYGQLDEYLDLGKGFFAPLDHKTRGFPVRDDSHSYYQLQMDIYTLLLEKNHYKTQKVAYLVFYYPLKSNLLHQGFPFEVEVREIKTNPQRAEEVFSQAVRTLALVEPPSYHETCPFCGWVETLNGLI